MQHRFELDGIPYEISLTRHASPSEGWRLDALGLSATVSLGVQGGDRCVLTLEGVKHPVAAVVEGDVVHVQINGRAYALRYRDPVDLHATAGEAGGQDVARAPMPGVVLAVQVRAGDLVRLGDTLLTIESMKMETSIKATRDGMVELVHVVAGQSFDRGAALVTLR